VKRWVLQLVSEFEFMKKMKGINGGGRIPKKAGDVTTQLQELQRKKEEQTKVNDKPKVEDFLPLIEKMKVKLVPIKNNYTAVKNQKDKVLTYLRNTKYGFSIETRNEAGNWIISKVTKQSELDNWVKEIENRLK